LVSYTELAAMLRAELDADADSRVAKALHDLLEALRACKLTAWGKRDVGEPNPAAQYEAIPASLFMDHRVSITEWGTISVNPEHPMAISEYRGPRFREARFYTAEVLSLSRS
jgi:hypothetical protein